MQDLSGDDLAKLIAYELSYMTLAERAECLQNLERRAKAEGNFRALRAIAIYRRSFLTRYRLHPEHPNGE